MYTFCAKISWIFGFVNKYECKLSDFANPSLALPEFGEGIATPSFSPSPLNSGERGWGEGVEQRYQFNRQPAQEVIVYE